MGLMSFSTLFMIGTDTFPAAPLLPLPQRELGVSRRRPRPMPARSHPTRVVRSRPLRMSPRAYLMFQTGNFEAPRQS